MANPTCTKCGYPLERSADGERWEDPMNMLPDICVDIDGTVGPMGEEGHIPHEEHHDQPAEEA